MELEEMKNTWDEYDRKLDRSLKLNMQLLRNLNYDRAKNKLNMLFSLKLMEMIILVAALAYLAQFIVNNWFVPQFSISAFMVGLLFIICFVYDVKQLIIIKQVQTGYNDAVAPIQKRIEELKLTIVIYVKYTLVLLPLYPLLLLLAGKMIFNVDFLEPQRRAYFISNACIGLVLLPFALWTLRQLNVKNLNTKTARVLLTGSGWHQANAARRFLDEIEKFEQDL